jgi:hypothetical protein
MKWVGCTQSLLQLLPGTGLNKLKRSLKTSREVAEIRPHLYKTTRVNSIQYVFTNTWRSKALKIPDGTAQKKNKMSYQAARGKALVGRICDAKARASGGTYFKWQQSMMKLECVWGHPHGLFLGIRIQRQIHIVRNLKPPHGVQS